MSKVAESRRKESNPGKGNNISMRLVQKSVYKIFYKLWGDCIHCALGTTCFEYYALLTAYGFRFAVKIFCRYLVSQEYVFTYISTCLDTVKLVKVGNNSKSVHLAQVPTLQRFYLQLIIIISSGTQVIVYTSHPFHQVPPFLFLIFPVFCTIFPWISLLDIYFTVDLRQ